jgi:NAD(P)-dependent dehydrogenase (short-subunit alcohol dehydrogenase family)
MAERTLDGKVALVTGAGSPRGLGRAIALALAGAGARVAIADVDEAAARAVATEADALGGKGCALPVRVDTSDAAQASAAVGATIAGLGGLHVLVNCAGINPHTVHGASEPLSFWKDSPQVWERVLAVNLNGYFHMARAASPHLLAQGWGRIISVTTSFDTMIRGQTAPYGPSKAGCEALASVMAADLEGTGVTSNVLVPGGATDTNMITAPDGFDRSRMLRPEVMAEPVVWLASSEADGFNGQRIIGSAWDGTLGLEARLARAAAPAAWPQLGRPNRR